MEQMDETAQLLYNPEQRMVDSFSVNTSSDEEDSKHYIPPKQIENEDKDKRQTKHKLIQSDDSDDSLELSKYGDFLILLDWDDTLFPTSMISELLNNRDENKCALVRDDQIENLRKLGHITYLLLSNLIENYGSHNIHIVTNSLNGWIKKSLNYAACIADIYLQIERLLIENNITMQSAQSLYGKTIKNSTPTQWKQYCFDVILKQSKPYSHILSIGDQWTDHYSVQDSIALLQHYPFQPTHHVIKLKMAPNLADMIHETLYIHTCCTQIMNAISSCQYSLSSPMRFDYHTEEIMCNYLNQYSQFTPTQYGV